MTQEWLGYGFGRMYNISHRAVPYTAADVPEHNPISPAILILQQLQSGIVPHAETTTGGVGDTQIQLASDQLL